MNELREIEKIVNDYGKVLKAASQMMFGASVSLLPHPKEEIKNAIKLYLVILSKLNKLDEELKNHMMNGYAWLAYFIPDEKAKIGLGVQLHMLKSAKRLTEKDMKDPKKLIEVASSLDIKDLQRAVNTSKEINREFNQNLKEIKKLVKDMQ